MSQAAAAAWEDTKNKAAYCLAIAVIIAILPGTAGLFAVAGVVGLGFMTVRLTKQFWSALSNEQRDALKAAANAADVKLAGLDEAARPCGCLMSRRKGKVRTFVEPKPKRRRLSKEMKEMLALQQELRKQDRFTRIRKDGKGGLYLEPVPPPPKRDAFYKSRKTGHIQN